MEKKVRKEKNPNQIRRIDGKNCFLEATKDAFEIGKIKLGFYKYDVTKEKGEKFTNDVLLYLDYGDFDNIFYDILISGSLIKKINMLDADTSKSPFDKQVIIYRGGSYDKKGELKARQLKIFKGMRKPIVLRAEIGKGIVNEKTGGYVMSGSPEQYVEIGMEYKDLEILILEIWKTVNAFECKKAMEKDFDDILFEVDRLKELLTLLCQSVNIDKTKLEEILIKEKPKPEYSNKNETNTAENKNKGTGYQNNNQSNGYQNNNQSNGYQNNNQSNGYQNNNQSNGYQNNNQGNGYHNNNQSNGYQNNNQSNGYQNNRY